MATKKSSAPTAKKRTGAKKPASRKRAPRGSSTAASASEQTAQVPSGEKLKEVARTIGSTVGDLVAKTKKVLKR